MRAEGMHVRADLDRAFRCFRGFLRKNLPRGPFKAWRAPETLGPHELQTLTPWARSGRWFLVGNTDVPSDFGDCGFRLT